jgi:MOSC domain-containing protein YiiM
MVGTLVSINVSNGGVPKLPVAFAAITVGGVTGDRQKDRKWHGGPDRAVSILALAVIRELQQQGHTLVPGSTGENLTIDGFRADELIPGARLRIGSDPATAVELELTTWLEPCGKIAGNFQGRNFSVFAHGQNPCRSRVGARVLRIGTVTAGDPVTLLPG